jgi:two-component system, OmpR family, response regulator
MDLSRNRRVVIADDDPGIRCLLVTFLRRQGFRTLEVGNGGEALAEMRAGKADMVVMDLMMPEVSGWDVLRERAADPLLQRIPIVVVTANGSREVTADLLDQDVDAVLGKPFDLDHLLTAVTACLEQPHVPTRAAA